jgi:sensor c-di-GMP phosphodiesterase-like protein
MHWRPISLPLCACHRLDALNAYHLLMLLTPAIRYSFIARHAHALSVLAGALFFVLAAVSSTFVVIQQNISELKEIHRSGALRAKSINISVDGLIALLSPNSELRCNEKSLGEIRAVMLQSRFIRDVGLYNDAGQLACTTGLGILANPLDDAPGGLRGAQGNLVWPSVPVLLGKGKVEAMVVRIGRFNVMLDPFAIDDILGAGIDSVWFQDEQGIAHRLTAGEHVDETTLDILRTQNIQPGEAYVNIDRGWVYVTTQIANTAYVFQSSRSLRALADMHSIEVGMLLVLSGLLGIATISVLTPRLLTYDSIERRIASLCNEQGVRCVYQPIIDLQSGAIAGCEVLMRLQDGQRIIFPDQAIPAIIAKGLTWDLDRTVCATAFRELAVHLPPVVDFKLAFNFFAADIEYARLAPYLQGLLKASGRKDLKVNIEITEYAYTDAMVAELRRFEDDGFLVSVDDFGTGYSNLGMVKKLHPDYLKIDKSFVFEMEDSSIRSSLIPEIIAIALAVKAEVIAEGVENEAQADRLRQMGARYAQGYHFAKPMPIEEFVAFYQNHQRLASLDVQPL